MHRAEPCTPTLAPRAGIGLRAEHYGEFLARRPALALVEVHSENYFGGGRHLDVLQQVRRSHDVSLHGVGLSLGSSDALNIRHLSSLKQLVDRIQPALVSDHLSWSSLGGVYTNDLLPLPCTHEALAHVARRVAHVQDVLGRQILVENVSSYLAWRHQDMPEQDFLAALVQQTGCGLLLDVNNLHVNAHNHGIDVAAYLHALPADAVREIHLAGHVANEVPLDDGSRGQILIDTHSRPVCAEVWAGYAQALRCLGPKPTIIEWDAELPPLQTLLDEAAHADRHLAHAPPPRESCDACTA